MSESILPYATPADATPRSSTGRTVFGVIVRTIGLLVTLYGIQLLLVILNLMLGITSKGRLADLHITEGGIALIVGLLLLRGGWLVRLAYGRSAD
jgi:hypothetical protein